MRQLGIILGFLLVSGESLFGAITITNSPSTGTVNAPYSFQFQATGCVPSCTWTLYMSSMPPGLNFNSPGGSITGTPTFANTYFFTVMVNDQASNNTMQGFSITINPPGGPLTIRNAPPNGTVGTAYNFQFNATGGNGSYLWSLNSDGPGPLPPGLTLSSAGLL